MIPIKRQEFFRHIHAGVLEPLFDRALLSLPLIEKQRSEVEAYVDQGNSVYGFSTLLGHLDKHTGFLKHQKVLHRGHLLGPAQPGDQNIFAHITLAKAIQLSHGGSGVSPESFQKVIEAGLKPDPAKTPGKLSLSSYGAGDVVPGACWVDLIFGEDINSGVLPRGDYIALINGNFVSLGTTLAALRQLRGVFQKALDIGAVMSRVDGSKHIKPTEEGPPTLNKGPLWTRDGQPPVSLRDFNPLVGIIEKTWQDLLDALWDSLGSPSGNPLFEHTENGEVRDNSQSSFLNLKLSQALLGTLDAVHHVARYVQRYTYHFCEAVSTDLEPEEQVLFVQPPKISAAIVTQISLLTQGLSAPMVSESEGIEDIADLALLRATNLQEAIGKLENLIDIFHQCAGNTGVVENFDEEFFDTGATLRQCLEFSAHLGPRVLSFN